MSNTQNNKTKIENRNYFIDVPADVLLQISDQLTMLNKQLREMSNQLIETNRRLAEKT